MMIRPISVSQKSNSNKYTVLLERKCRDACTLSVIPTALVCLLFGPAVPSLLSIQIFVLLFILVSLFIDSIGVFV